jgi:hypothetical protein
MPDRTEKIPASIELVGDEHPMPFSHRYTNQNGAGEIGLEVGDRFEANPAFGSDEAAIMRQIGMDMLLKGMHLIGVDSEMRRGLAMLVLKSAGDVSLDLVDESGG